MFDNQRIERDVVDMSRHILTYEQMNGGKKLERHTFHYNFNNVFLRIT